MLTLKYILRVDGEDYEDEYIEWDDQLIYIEHAVAVRFIEVEAEDETAAAKALAKKLDPSWLVYGAVDENEVPVAATIERCGVEGPQQANNRHGIVGSP